MSLHNVAAKKMTSGPDSIRYGATEIVNEHHRSTNTGNSAMILIDSFLSDNLSLENGWFSHGADGDSTRGGGR